MIRRYLPALSMLAVALCTFTLGTSGLGAQTPPARPTRPVPVPATKPTPAPRPAAPRDPYSPYGDAFIDAKMSGMFDAERVAAMAARASEAAMASSANAMARAEAAVAMSMDKLRDVDFSGLAALAPMAPMSPMPPMKFDFDFNFDALRYTPRGGLYEGSYEGSYSGRYIDDSRVSSRAPEAWAKDDPADSLYREARKALSGNSYRKAAELFRRIRDQYPKSTYTPDAPYWEAFALQRLGNESDLRAAQEALTWQSKQFPKASTRGDAVALGTRIDGALAQRGDREAYKGLVNVVDKANSQGCPRENDDERVTALNALARMDSAQVLPVIKKALARREACTQALRRTAVWLYARSKAPDAPQVLMNVAKNDPDREVRDQAVFWMANVPTDEAVGMLIDLAKNGSDIDLRKRAVYALSRSKTTRATNTLREIAADANAPSDLRSESLQWYLSSSNRTADEAMSVLKEAYGKADDQRFRNSVLGQIARRKTDEARAFLAEVAQNDRESLETRRNALSSLYSAGATSQQLSTIYDKSANDIELRKSVLGLLGNLRENAGVDKLLDVARNEKNPELKKQAVGYLYRTKDPRAMALLQEIIDR